MVSPFERPMVSQIEMKELPEGQGQIQKVKNKKEGHASTENGWWIFLGCWEGPWVFLLGLLSLVFSYLKAFVVSFERLYT